MRLWTATCLVLSAVGCATATENENDGLDKSDPDATSGQDGSGGSLATGGNASGSASSATGGNSGTGGAAASGGAGTGGSSSGGTSSGGTGAGGMSSGGAGTGGSSTGGAGTGGAAATCGDDLKNQDETDKDCGGDICEKCADLKSCVDARDCQSGVCSGLVCAEPTCSDNVKNGTEAARDCGGDDCDACVFDTFNYTTGTTTTTASFEVSYDANHLYLSIDVQDSTENNASALAWQDDSVEIYLDLSNNKSGSFDGNDFQLIVTRDGEKTQGDNSAAIDLGLVVASITNSSTSYQIDLTIPWNALGGASSPLGATIGLDLGVNDDIDGGDTRDAQFIWFGGEFSYANPSLWGELTLQ